MSLTEFLLARLGEDAERLVHEFDCDRFEVYDHGCRQGKCDCDATERLLADVEAKRRIVVRCQEMQAASLPMAVHLASQTLADLARPYVDHPDYREEWRP